jgi:CubicO group peptidase (beta-lactamase class C family)
MHYRQGFFAVAAALLFGGASLAQEKRADLATELDGVFAGASAPGAAVVVIENGEVLLSKAYGLADVAARTPATPQTVFRVGSVGKSVVGVIVMMLVEEGKVSLDDKLADIAPEIPFTNPWESEEPIRLKHLLEHTTGWADLSPKEFALDNPAMSLLDGVLVGGARKTRYRPGVYHAYTSAGYGIAGYIVEKIEGKPFRDVARERLFEPLGMTSATYDEVDGIAKSYMPDGTPTRYQHYPLYPAGGLNLSADDLAKFAQFMINGGKAGDRALLSPDSIARIERSEATLAALAGLADGYGLGNTPYIGERTIFRGHGGAIDSFEADYRYNRGCRCGFVIVANGGEMPRAAVTAITSHLTEGLPEPAASERVTSELGEFSGIYQPIAQRNRLTRLVDSLTAFRRLEIGLDGKAALDGVEYAADVEGRLRRTARAAPAFVLARSDDGTLLLGATESFRKVSARSIQAKAAYGLLFALALLAAFFSFFGALFSGRLTKAHAAALAAFLPFFAIVGLFAYGVELPSPKSISLFGRESWLSYSVFAATSLAPILGALSVLAGLSRGRARVGTRAVAVIAGGLALIASFYMVSFGWLALRTWAI